MLAEIDVPSVIVLGPPHLARDVVTHAVAEAGMYRIDLRSTVEGVADVVVLIDPRPVDWTSACSIGVPIVLVSLDPIPDTVLPELIRLGASAAVDLSDGVDHVIDTVHRIREHGAALTAAQTCVLVSALRNSQSAEAGSRPELTARERDVLLSIIRGESTKQTARALEISIKTVENVQSRLYLKLNVRTRAQAVARAHSLSLLVSPDLAEESAS